MIDVMGEHDDFLHVVPLLSWCLFIKSHPGSIIKCHQNVKSSGETKGWFVRGRMR